MKNKGMYLLVSVIVIAALTISGCLLFKKVKAGGKPGRPGMAAHKDQTVTVTTTKVARTTMQRSITLNGKIKPVSEAEISAKVSGKVSRIYFELGQTVKKGDILFKLDDRDFRLDLKEAEAGLNVTRTALDSSLLTAKTNYEDAKRHYERLKRLYEKQIGSKQDLEEAESTYKLKEDAYNAAKLAAQNGVTNARAQLEKARVTYENAKLQLEYTVVRAPIGGTIATKDIKVGQYISAGTMVATMVDLSALTVETNVPENYINRLQPGDQVEVSVKAIAAQPFLGKINAIAPAVDNTTLNYPVKVRVPNPKNQLKSGMFATVKLTLDRAEQVLAVPLAALGEESGRKYVFTVNRGIAAKKIIITGLSDAQMVQVTDGLTEDEVVVVKGVNQLKAGSKVMIGK
jgi:multidrug efflux pump subunit AcrA (membrane-fusion protein)